MAELFKLDATSLYLFEQDGTQLRRIAAVGHRSEISKRFPPVPVKPELMQHIKAVHATFLSVQGLSLPPIFRDVQAREEIVAAYVVILWSKDRVIGGDRKSTRLNSSHQIISYAVFCLKKKNIL